MMSTSLTNLAACLFLLKRSYQVALTASETLRELVWMMGLKLTEPSNFTNPSSIYCGGNFQPKTHHSELFTFSPQCEPVCEVILEAQ